MKTFNLIASKTQRFFFGVGLLAAAFAVSCTTSDMEPGPLTIDDANVSADLVASADFEEVDDITANMMAIAEASQGGRLDAGGHDDRCSCAEVTHDKENQIITIDFGEGCTGPNGVERSGKIIIQYDGRRFLPGSTWVTTFEDFYVNDRHIEGTRTVTNISDDIFSDPTFHIVLEGGKVTWPDESFATREADKIRVWKRAANPLLDEIHILAESITAGINREEVRYMTLIKEDLVFKRACRNSKRGRIPVAGVKEVSLGERVYTIDFGDGECDTIITITSGDETRTVDLADR
jgi:hypothetical protein